MASLDDILTTQKNGVVAINGLNQTMRQIEADLIVADTSLAAISTTLSKMYTNFRNVHLFNGAAGTSVATLYTSPASTVSCVTDIMIANTAATSATFYLFIVPAAGSASAANALFYAVPIAANTTVQWTGNQAISTGATLQGYASATSVTFSVTGVLST
jgi:hypothetical protein